MSGIAIADIIATLTAGKNIIHSLEPIANSLGVPKQVTDLINTVTEIGVNVLDRIDEGKVVATSHDQEQVQAINEELAVINDRLANRIAAYTPDP